MKQQDKAEIRPSSLRGVARGSSLQFIYILILFILSFKCWKHAKLRYHENENNFLS